MNKPKLRWKTLRMRDSATGKRMRIQVPHGNTKVSLLGIRTVRYSEIGRMARESASELMKLLGTT